MPISLGTTTITALFLGTTSITSAYLGSTQVFGGSFTPLDLFSGGAQGIWLDPSDLSTMFSDRAGTVPITTPGTVVGKRLDKSGRNNHATAPTDAARPIYGVEPKGGRRNLLTWSEDFGNAAWSNASGTLNVTANATTAPDGTLSADKLVPAAATTYFAKRQAIFTSVIGTSYSFSAYAKEGDAGVHLELISYNAASPIPAAVFNLSTGAVLASRGCTTSVGAADAYGFRRYSITFTATAAAASITDWKLTESSSLDQNMTGNGSKGLFAWGAQLEAGTLSAYQRVLSAYDVTESGVATCHYVQYDGSDDSMSTAAIDFTGTDKMSVFAGVRKNVDTGTGIVVELGPLTADVRSFNLAAPNGGSNYGLGLLQKVTAPPIYATGWAAPFVAPTTNVVSGIFDWAGVGNAGKIVGRVNGAAQTLDFTNSGGTLTAGNFGNLPLYFGRRNNASLPFNGRDYGLIVVGKTASAGEISDTETWLAARTSGVSI